MYDTVLANITLNDALHEERLQQALELTGIASLLPGLPAGIDTVLTGKWQEHHQRRPTPTHCPGAGIMTKTPIYLFWMNPSSELDEKAEEQLLQHLQQMATAGKVVILVTHNKKSLEKRDRTITFYKAAASRYSLKPKD